MNEKRGKTVVSFFNGISIGRLALTKMGVPIKQYYSIENDPYANAISRTHWNNTELGDVTKINFNDLPKIDIAFCSAPCQDLSFAGKQKGFAEGTRSSLFFKFIEFLDNQEKRFGVRPHFLVEQVRMKKENLKIMEDLLGVKGVMINSSFFSAQNRQRLYFCNFDIPEYKDRGILLKDILENEEDWFVNRDKAYPITATYSGACPRDYFEKSQRQLVFTDRDKSHCIDANYFKGGNLKSYFEKHRRQLVFNRCLQVGEADIKGRDSLKRVYSPEGKAPTVTTCGGGHREPKVYVEPLKWRKLTPRECEALQTVPRDYTAHGAEVDGSYKKISNTRRYKALGNGWTTEVIIHILTGLIKN